MTAAAAAELNRSCLCVGVDTADVFRGLADVLRGPAGVLRGIATASGLTDDLQQTHPGLFSSQAVFVGRDDVDAMQTLVAAVERVVALPGYRQAALEDAPAIAARLPPREAVLHGFDFHLTDDGPRLIEINTNAGGITLAGALSRALRVPCLQPDELQTGAEHDLDERLWRMFEDVWQRARGARPLTRVAIVDEQPAGQYLYPEFLLFQSLFRRRGLAVVIASPEELALRGGLLWYKGEPIDLVYNRLTDFYLEAPAHEVLREAVLANAVVLTPDPRAHALYANKRNLARLTDRDALRRWGVAESIAETLLRYIPPTENVRAESAERLWSNRKRLFFKPARGYGSRGSYRGDKLTRGRFGEILNGDYVAQALIPPATRIAGTGAVDGFRFDVRSYVYRGRSLLLAARVYRGQTTNFRTAGGGFAPLLFPPSEPSPCSKPCTSPSLT